MKKWALCAVLLCVSWTSVLGGAPAFQDLDFESATLEFAPGGPTATFAVPFAPAFPGWTGYVGSSQVETALYDRTYLDTAAISILDTNPLPPGVFGELIDGNYTAVLQADFYPGLGPVAVSLAQTGLVPSGTKSLAFYALALGQAASSFTVSLGGTNLDLISFPVPNKNYTLCEADVSAFAGLVEELKFTLFPALPNGDNRYLSLDDIMFSPDAIPEPSSLILLTVGILGLSAWCVPRRKLRPKDTSRSLS
jgi:hypothetical protein